MLKNKYKFIRRISRHKLIWAGASAILFFFYIFFIPPASVLSFVAFYILCGFALFRLLFLIFRFGVSIRWTLGILTILYLRQLQIDVTISTFLLIGVLISVELLLQKR